MTRENRCRTARKNAGLSLGQAARLSGLEVEQLETIESDDAVNVARNIEYAQRLADLYHVRLEWMTGEVERCDYASIKRMNGSEDLSFRDLETLAEFAASLPRKKTP